MENLEQEDIRFQELAKKYVFRKEDFKSYKPKKYYQEGSNELELTREISELNNSFTQLPYADELPNGIVSFVAGRITAIEKYGDFINENRIRIYRFKVFGMMMIPSCMKKIIIDNSIYQPQNMGIFAALPHEIRVKNDLEYKMDLYQNVNKIIYEDQYPTWQEYVYASNRITNRALKDKIQLFKEK